MKKYNLMGDVIIHKQSMFSREMTFLSRDSAVTHGGGGGG